MGKYAQQSSEIKKSKKEIFILENHLRISFFVEIMKPEKCPIPVIDPERLRWSGVLRAGNHNVSTEKMKFHKYTYTFSKSTILMQ